MITTTALRFDRQINGREFRIEVRSVGDNRWRAQVVTAHGGPTALMPFYGPTPERAAHELAAWLARAHGATAPAP